jgi:hypothetical protein
VTRSPEAKDTAHVLVVAHRTAATPALVDAIRDRAAQGSARFTLLVPNTPKGLSRVMNPEEGDVQSAREALDQAVPLLSEAAGSEVDGMIGDPNPLSAVEDAVNAGTYDEIIISTLPRTVSRWLRLDLPHKVAALGLPVTTITPDSLPGTEPSGERHTVNS